MTRAQPHAEHSPIQREEKEDQLGVESRATLGWGSGDPAGRGGCVAGDRSPLLSLSAELSTETSLAPSSAITPGLSYWGASPGCDQSTQYALVSRTSR